MTPQSSNAQQTTGANANQCDTICEQLANSMSTQHPTQVLLSAQKTCTNKCRPMLEQRCGKLSLETKTSATFSAKQVSGDIHYTCILDNVNGNSATNGAKGGKSNTSNPKDETDDNAMAQNPQCKTICDNLDLTPEKIYRNRQILPNASCQAACKPRLQEACTNLTKINKPLTFGTDKIRITQASAIFKENAQGKIEYYCEFSSTILK